jgi:hypothetical protein
MGNDHLSSQIKSSFKDVWVTRLLTYVEKNPKFGDVQKEIENAVDSGCDEEGKNVASLLLLSLYVPCSCALVTSWVFNN